MNPRWQRRYPFKERFFGRHGREVSQTVDAGFRFMPSEMKLGSELRYCPACQDQTNNFSVPTIGAIRRDKILFCLDCSTIVLKPEHLGEAASAHITVEVRYHDGGWENITDDYCAGMPLAMIHSACRVKRGTEMMRVGSISRRNGFELHYECPACLVERLIKVMKSLTVVSDG